MMKQGSIGWSWALLCVLSVVAPSCGGSGPERCLTASECQTACVVGDRILVQWEESDVPGTCAETCVGSDDCDDGLVCANVDAGTRACIPRCATHEDTPLGFGCVDGVPTPCSQAQPGDMPCDRCCDPLTDCALCGGGEFCDAFETGACVALRAIGESCYFQEECASNNCAGATGDGAGTCLAAHGDPCDGSDCSRCITTNATTFCHQECFGRLGCPVGFQNCLGSQADDRYWCHQDANGFSCPPGYDDYTYQEWNGAPFRTACIPLTNAFVCGSASVGSPCE